MLNFLKNTKETLEIFQAKKILTCAAIIHFSFGLIMLFNDIPYSFLSNIMLGSLYLFSLIFIKINSFNKTIHSIFALVALHVISTSFTFGFSSGYEYLLLAIIAYSHMGVYTSKTVPYTISFLGFLLYSLLLYLCDYKNYSLNYKINAYDIDFDFFLSLFHSFFISTIFIVVSNAVRKQKDKNIENRHNLEQMLKNSIGIDSLTKLKTRWYFLKNLNNIEGNDNVVLAIIDIDNFKQINKTSGYEIGDDILIECGKLIKSHFNQYTNFLCRWGAEEFVILINNKPEHEFFKKCENFLKDFENSMLASFKIKLNASIGILQIDSNFKTQKFDEYLIKVEQCLNKAKTYTREKIVIDYIV